MKSFALSLLIVVLFRAGAFAADQDSLRGLDFLLGEWRGDPPTQGVDVFRRDLDGKVIVRTAQANAGNGARDVAMKMAMTIYAEPGRGVRAIYFDNDGHVIHYTVSELVPGRSVRFDSDAGSPGPRFRLAYSVRSGDALAVKFEMALPGEHSEFTTIAEGMDKRVTH